MKNAIRAALAMALWAPLAASQNCQSTSVGLTPLNDLGSGTYMGFEGGLYPNGSNSPPLGHLIGGLNEARDVVPRDAAGNPDPQGTIGMISIGMSNTRIHFQAFRNAAEQDPLKDPRVLVLNTAQGGQPAEDMDEPTDSYWSFVDAMLAQAGLAPAQVQVAWLLQANRQPSDPFPLHAETFQAQVTSIVQIARDRFPNLRLLFFGTRIYAGYATTTLNPEPWAYEYGFALKWLIEAQLGGDPALNYRPAQGAVEAPWIGWGAYMWADGLTPRSDGLTWECADLNPDGTHPSAQGATKHAGYLLEFFQTDPVARMAYLAAPEPADYGFGKPSSIGLEPLLGALGAPSATSDDFRVRVENAVPGEAALLLWSTGAASAPWYGARRWLAGPLNRKFPLRIVAPDGRATFGVGVDPTMAGTTRFYQVLYRDPSHPDGTGVGLSDALVVRFRD